MRSVSVLILFVACCGLAFADDTATRNAYFRDKLLATMKTDATATPPPATMTIDGAWKVRKDNPGLPASTTDAWTIGYLSGCKYYIGSTSVLLKGTSTKLRVETGNVEGINKLSAFANDENNAGALVILKVRAASGLYQDANNYGFENDKYLSFDILEIARMDEVVAWCLLAVIPLPTFVQDMILPPGDPPPSPPGGSIP